MAFTMTEPESPERARNIIKCLAKYRNVQLTPEQIERLAQSRVHALAVA